MTTTANEMIRFIESTVGHHVFNLSEEDIDNLFSCSVELNLEPQDERLVRSAVLRLYSMASQDRAKFAEISPRFGIDPDFNEYCEREAMLTAEAWENEQNLPNRFCLFICDMVNDSVPSGDYFYNYMMQIVDGRIG